MRLFKKTIRPGLAVFLIAVLVFWPQLSSADEARKARVP